MSVWKWVRGRIEWLWPLRQAGPEAVAFESPLTMKLRVYAVWISVGPDQCLSRDELQSLRGAGVGVRHWWLRHESYGFARLELPRGDIPWRRGVLLPAGRYTIGVGHGDAARRIVFTIDPMDSARG